MQAQQVNRAVVLRRSTERLAAKPKRVRPLRGMPSAPGPIRNRKAPKLTGTQRNSVGGRSEWRLSPYAPRGGWR